MTTELFPRFTETNHLLQGTHRLKIGFGSEIAN